MKKRLLVLLVIMFPMLLLAQPMDTSTVYRENFEGDSVKMTSSHLPAGGGALGDWRLVGPDQTYESTWNNLPLYKSPVHSFHSPVYSSAGNSQASTDAIPLSSPGLDVNYVYIDFDHICKVNYLDNATLYYQVAEGFDEYGNYNWGQWKMLNFASNSEFYYGDAKSTTNAAFSGGALSDKMYSIWNSNSLTAVPNNDTWWRHEMIDLTSKIFVEGTNPTHFRFQWRLNKTSPSTSGTDVCAGWYIDNIFVRLSNCELIRPKITMVAPFFYNTNSSFTNNVGPYTIKATLFDNDTIETSLVQFSYEINSGSTVIVPNTDAFTSNVLNASGHTIQAQWVLPSICYQDTIYYHIYLEDTHGSNTRFDTFLVAHHNYTDIHQNDIRLDSLNSMPHCLITDTAQNVVVYFTNRSDAINSPGTSTMTSGTFTIEVRDENGALFHTNTSSWTGDICFDIPSSLSLGSFAPRHGYNYVTVYVNTRNGQTDGFHANDTIRIAPYSCDSLLRGDYTVGGTNPDFANMQAVKEALDFCGLGGPVVFHLRPGTYTDFDFDVNYIGQSAVNTITFQGDDVNTVIVTNNQTDAGANTFGAVTLVNVKDYIFKNLTIQGNETATPSRGVVVRGNGSTNILFEGCKITAYNTHSTDITSSAVSRTTAVPNTAAFYPDTITIRNCTITGGNFGVHYVGSNTRKNMVTIERCNITSCYRGIYTNYTNGSITNNHIKQVSSSNPQNFTGIYSNYPVGADINNNTVDSVLKLEYGIYLGNAANSADFYVRNNRVHVGNGTAGIYLTASSSTNNITGYLYNNEVILYPVTAANSYAVQINNSNALQIINNSFLAKSDAPFSNSAALHISTTGNQATRLYNNLLLNQVVCSDRTDYPLYLNGTTKASGRYNDFISGSGVVAYKTVPRNTVAELEAADTTLSHSISYLPPFANVTQSLLPTSFTELECWRNNAVLTDIRGINRSEVTYMGAYADAIPSIDAALTALVSPALGECPQPSYDIAVAITNKGAQTINFASNQAVIHLHSTAMNLDQNFTINTGSVTALNSITQVLLQNVSIPANQAVDFQIIINTSGDNNHSNDTLSQVFVLETIVPDYEEDFSNGTQQTWTIQQISGAGNWTFQNGTGVNPTIAPVYGIGRLFFNSKNFSTSTVSRAILPVVTLTNSVNPILELWFAHDNTSNKPDEGVTVKISTDGGVTYTNLIPQGQTTALLKRYKQTATTPEWQLYTFDLANYVSNECVYIAFDAAAKGGNNINIDRIRVRNLYDNDVSVTKIYGAGETPTEYSMRGVVSALVKNEGALGQSNVQVYLNVVGATEQWQDTLTIPSLPYNTETLITFPDHQYNVQEVKDVEVRAADDQHNINNTQHWRMVTTQNAATIADTTTDIVLLGDYTSIIRPCVRYKTNEELAVTAVKYYYDQTYIADPENGFKAFVADAAGNILATSELVDFSTLQQGAWNTIPIYNFALTNTIGEFYVGLEMFAHGNYLVAQVESPLRDSTFYYLQNGTYVPQTSGRFMIGAVVDTPFVHDVALLELAHPVTNCDLGHEHLKVRITNNGTADIVPPIQLHYTINGGAVVTEAFTDTLHSHETTLFTFASDYDFTNHLISYDSNYIINVWSTKLAQDRLTFNDSLNVLVVSRGKSPLPIAPDTVIVNYHTSTTLSAQLPASIQQGVIGWYTSTGYESWNLLGYSPTYTTPLIYFDTTYYATANPGTVDDVIVGTGTASGTDPFTFSNGYSRGRVLYLAQEIGAYGTITSFALNVKTAANAAGADGIPMKIYMKCTEDNVFNSTNVNWEDEINNATLVVDDRVFFDQTGWFYFDMVTPFNFNSGNLVIFTETNCADYCTGTGSQCNNCGPYVSGSPTTGYPSFAKTNSPAGTTLCQKKAGNSESQMIGAYSNVNARPNVRFTVANLECGSEKVPIRLHVPDIPTYDVETQELLEPVTGCALYDEHIKVQVKNMLNISVPANKVVVHAVFNGSEITHVVAEEFAPEEVKIVEFSTPFDFSAPTTDITFNYTIYTTLNNEAVVYTGNDTISGNFVSWRTAYLPDSIVYMGTYTNPYDILQPDDRPTDINQYNFYANETDATPIYTSTTAHPYYTTPDLYDTAVYWMTGTTKNGSAAQGNHNCVTKRIKVIVNVFHPQYDLSTDELIYPVSYQCLTSLNPNLQVSVTNQDTASTSVIPAGTFNLNAQFTGSANVNGVSLINDPVASLVQDTITFDNGMNLGSSTQNRIYQYVIYTTPAEASMPVYTLNDTIYGTMYIPALPVAPQPLTYTVPYGGTQTVTPGTSALNYFYFYENANDEQAMAEGSSFITEPIFAPTTYYYSGRIESDGFNAPVIAGTGNDHSDVMFTFSKGHSYAKMLYNKEDMGGAEGRIDSIFFQVSTAETNGIPIPMKFWLKDTTNVQAIATGNKSINWAAETADATLVFDGEIALDQQGWVGFAVTGGFDFNGEGLLLFAEHDCGGNSCLNTYGINPVPKFSNSSTSGNRAYIYSNNNPVSGAPSFSGKNKRVNTKFKMNYTCESPKATITINTTVPQQDVGVVAITAPVSQSNSFTANENVTVTLQNFGSQAASNIPVSYQLANGTPVTQNYSGSIASGATATMTFNTQADLTSVYLPTPFSAYTALTGDTYPDNDTTTILLSAEDPCPSRPLSSHDGAHITNVTMGSLNNGTGTPYTNHSAAPGDGMYTDYTQTVAPVTLILGQEYALSVTHAFTASTTKTVHKKAYIDYNRNGVFTDPGEEVFSFPSIPAGDTNAVTTGFVNVPTTATAGYSRMRVICSTVALTSSGNNANSPCGFFNGDGETEEYAVLLSPPMEVDLGIPVILHPDGEVCADTNAIMRINVRNYGTASQTLTTDNPVTLTATITGAVPATYTKVVDNATLSPNSEITVEIPNVNLSVPGQYHVDVVLTYAGDQYMTNNTRGIDASVSNIPVEQLPFVEPFNPQNTDLTNPQLAAGWEVTSEANNYVWKETVGASAHNNTGGGPAHDHTFAGTYQENLGGYVSIPGQNNNANSGIYSKWTSLTSGCINMHYRNGYPSELNFYKYFADKSGADFVMRVETGSGSHYQTIAQFTKADGGQIGGNDEWNDTLLVLHTVDEVARLRFTVTNQYKLIDPSIDDIDLIVGRPDMAVKRIVYPEPESDTTGCLGLNSIMSPVVELYNNGNSAVEAFDVEFKVGVGNDIVTATEHITHHLEPGESLEYTSTNEFVVTDLTHLWQVWATVIIPDDKYEYNNNKRVVTCTDVSVPEYEGENGVNLGQNEPNPAVTATRIPYSMPVAGKVSFEITTADGKVVYTTTEEAERGDNYLDISTANLSNGVYYYTLRYKDIVLTKKMVVER
ncbi:MAG: T9SS type A sorting domain-containing protein [Bacteroidales bacterium]|nr:T9SS type A sorting domain-containing protein [Bacteroidales bacterium]